MPAALRPTGVRAQRDKHVVAMPAERGAVFVSETEEVPEGARVIFSADQRAHARSSDHGCAMSAPRSVRCRVRMSRRGGLGWFSRHCGNLPTGLDRWPQHRAWG